MTKLCNTCEYLRYCARSGIEDVGCDRYKRDTTTNEEWFCNLDTEDKAREIYKIAKDGFKELRKLFYGVANDDCDAVALWLKQPHTEKE